MNAPMQSAKKPSALNFSAIALAVVSAVLLTGCNTLERSRSLANPAVGPTVIAQQVCSNCHGNEKPAVAGTPPPASLKTVRTRLTPEAALQVIEHGRGQMPSFASRAAVARRALVSFLYGQGGGETVSAG